jgi:L-malate glycosyltransferase
MKRILVICPAPEEVYPSQRLKYEQYFGHWRENGYDITIAPFMSMSLWSVIYKKGYYLTKITLTLWGYLRRVYDIIRSPFYDLVYVHLWVTPFGASAYERLLKLANPHIVYDIDDAVYKGHKSKSNWFIGWMKGKKKIFTLMKIASHVIVCTKYLEEEALKYNTKVTDISSTFDTERFTPVESYEVEDKVCLGWTGSHSTIPFLHLLDKVLLELASKYDYKLMVVCDVDFELDGVEIENIRWTEENEVSDLHKMNIGLYPTPTEEWVLGKSGLKALTYQSCAIPCVATAFGSNLENIRHGENGMLANNNEEWVDSISKLIDSKELRGKIGKAGRENVMNNFSVDANKSVYLNILNSVVKK